MFSNFTAIFDLIEKLCFTEKLKQKKMLANQDKTIQEGLIAPGTPQDHQGETHLYERVDGQPETSVCVIGTKGQGQNENEDQDGYLLPTNRQRETYISVIGTEGQDHYENRENEEKEGYVPMNREVNEQDGYVLPTCMNRNPETSICVIGTKGQGHYENRVGIENQDGSVPKKREVMTLTQGGATYDNIQNYENRAFIKSDQKNVYEGLQITRDEHPYADL